MTAAIVSPRFASAIGAGFFPSRCTIDAKTVTADAYGEEVEVWASVGSVVDVACAKAPLSAIERQAGGFTATDQVWNVLLQGAYPAITTRHRAIVDGVAYDIDAAETDQTGSLTKLRVRSVTT